MKIPPVYLYVLLVFVTAWPGKSASAQEFRAVWVTRFEWPRPDADTCRKNIDEIMKMLAANRFNAVLFQVRGQCDTFYPSPEEPWSPIISPGGHDPGFGDFDPLAYAIQAAHARGLEFHAYINTHVAWQSAKRELPKAGSHVFYQHLNAADSNARDWLACDAGGLPVQWGEDDYVWIAPGVPAAQAYIRRQIMHVVSNYPVDGVHLDRIRTGGAEFSRDPLSMKRWSDEQTNPYRLDFDAWTCDQITRFCCDLYAQMAEINPSIKLSSSPLALTRQELYPEYPADFHYAVAKAHQDAQAWLAAGAMDFVAPQIYWSDSDNQQPDFSHVLPDWINHAAGRHVYAGMRGRHSATELAHQINVTRSSGGQGSVIFSYSDLTKNRRFAALSRRGTGVYASVASIPPMSWKDANRATEGIIIGKMTDAHTDQPIADVQIRRTGSEEVALSSGDGIYSFLKVPPGRFHLSIFKPGWSELRIEDVDMAAGGVVRVDATLKPAPAADYDTQMNQPAEAVTTTAETHPEARPPKVKVIETKVKVERPMLTVLRWLLYSMLGIAVLMGAVAAGVMIERRKNTRKPRGRKK